MIVRPGRVYGKSRQTLPESLPSTPRRPLAATEELAEELTESLRSEGSLRRKELRPLPRGRKR